MNLVLLGIEALKPRAAWLYEAMSADFRMATSWARVGSADPATLSAASTHATIHRATASAPARRQDVSNF